MQVEDETHFKTRQLSAGGPAVLIGTCASTIFLYLIFSSVVFRIGLLRDSPRGQIWGGFFNP
jgi:hypothetical protein